MTAATTTTRPALWRNRDFVTLWSGQVVSALGARISATAMPLLVLATTGSPADAGLVGAAGQRRTPAAGFVLGECRG